MIDWGVLPQALISEMALGKGIGCELRRFDVLGTLPFVMHSEFFPFDL